MKTKILAVAIATLMGGAASAVASHDRVSRGPVVTHGSTVVHHYGAPRARTVTYANAPVARHVVHVQHAPRYYHPPRRPVYVHPPPVYVHPPPVYVAPVCPPPVYVAPPAPRFSFHIRF